MGGRGQISLARSLRSTTGWRAGPWWRPARHSFNAALSGLRDDLEADLERQPHRAWLCGMDMTIGHGAGLGRQARLVEVLDVVHLAIEHVEHIECELAALTESTAQAQI